MRKSYRFVLDKTKLYILAFAIIITTALMPAQFSYAANSKQTGKINTDSLNVRSGPGKDYEKIGRVFDSDTLSIVGEKDGWYIIDYNGTQGYVAASYVDVTEVAGTEDTEGASEETDVNEEEEETGGIFENYKIPLIILGVIVVLVLIMIITLKGIRNMDEDDENDEDDEDEYEDDEDEDDEEEDDDEDEDEYVAHRQPVRHQTPRSQQTRPQQRPQQARPQQRPVQPRPAQTRTTESSVEKKAKELSLLYSNNPDDFRIDIDPSFFEDEKKIPQPPKASQKDEDLKRAMEKMEELQREIERIKNED